MCVISCIFDVYWGGGGGGCHPDLFLKLGPVTKLLRGSWTPTAHLYHITIIPYHLNMPKTYSYPDLSVKLVFEITVVQ